MKTYTNEGKAVTEMKRLNRFAIKKTSDLYALVDGPDDGEYTIMPLKDAIDGGFGYRWDA